MHRDDGENFVQPLVDTSMELRLRDELFEEGPDFELDNDSQDTDDRQATTSNDTEVVLGPSRRVSFFPHPSKCRKDLEELRAFAYEHLGSGSGRDPKDGENHNNGENRGHGGYGKKQVYGEECDHSEGDEDGESYEQIEDPGYGGDPGYM